MAQRDEYTDTEWATLVGAPVAVIAAVIGASPSGPVGISQEVAAAVAFFERSAQERRDNPLIAGLLLTLKDRFEAFGGKQSDDRSVEQVDLFALGTNRELALATIGEAGALLAQKAPEAIGAELRDWLLELAGAVADAATEGGFLGIGGEQVSANEREVVAAIAAALQRP
jgi:hypothetical protein